MRRVIVLYLALMLLVPCLATAQELSPPADGKARVYYFNFLSTLARNAVHLYDGDRYVGSIRSSHCHGVDMDPGEHVLWSRILNKKYFIKANLAAGKTYYVHVVPQPGSKYNPASSPKMANACPNSKKGKGVYRTIQKRLSNNKFTEEDANTPEHLAEAQEADAATIAEVLEIWETEWKNKKWGKIESGDGD